MDIDRCHVAECADQAAGQGNYGADVDEQRGLAEDLETLNSTAGKVDHQQAEDSMPEQVNICVRLGNQGLGDKNYGKPDKKIQGKFL